MLGYTREKVLTQLTAFLDEDIERRLVAAGVEATVVAPAISWIIVTMVTMRLGATVTMVTMRYIAIYGDGYHGYHGYPGHTSVHHPL